MSKSKITPEKLETAINKLWQIEGSLKGLGALFEQQGKGANFESDELFGIGQLLKNLSCDIASIEKLLRCSDNFR